MKKTTAIGILVIITFTYQGCNKMELSPQSEAYSSVPILPQATINYDESINDDLATLGRVLFYDKKMSLNNSVSCGSCHQQSKAFCDNLQFSSGLQDLKTRRNTPSITRKSTGLFWDGRANNFYDLALMPLVNHVEMKNYDIPQLEKKIKSISYYNDLFTKAYGTDEVTIKKIQQSIAEFLVNFTFNKNQNYVVNYWGGSYTVEQQLGLDLFWGKAKCANCHSGPDFDGWGGGKECIGLDETYADNGVGELTKNSADNALFRIPSLLNIEFTAPYMHDGRFKTLEEVIEHYNSGIKPHPNLSWSLFEFEGTEGLTEAQLLLKFDINLDGQITEDELPTKKPIKLNLTEGEKKALVAFLKALSDRTIYTDMRFSDPFVIRK